MTILLLKIVGALALLIYGMKVMSEALQNWLVHSCAMCLAP